MFTTRKHKALERQTLAQRLAVAAFEASDGTLEFHSNCCGYSIGVFSLLSFRREHHG